MTRVFVFSLLLLAPTLAAAQAPRDPILRAEIDRESAIAGQPVTLRVTLLVPTWMPKPPVFPSFEVLNVMVRLPPRASRPASERIGGEMWSGVTRTYRLYPMVVGRFRIPAQPVTVTYADPDTRAPVTMDLLTKEIVFEGVAPQDAGNLDPFIAAETLTLEQKIEGEPGNLEPGSSFTRTVTATVKGTSPIFLPPLIPSVAAPGLATYPKEPLVTEAGDGVAVSGTRVESVTYVAEAGGRHAAPPISLSWFNLGTEQIDTAEVDGFEIVSRGPLPEPSSNFDRQAAATWIVVGVLLIALATAAVRQHRRRATAWVQRQRAAYRASEAFAFKQAMTALRARNFSDALRATELWSSRLPATAGFEDERLTAALERLGAALYGDNTASPSSAEWSIAEAALGAARRARRGAAAAEGAGGVLPPLNPRSVS